MIFSTILGPRVARADFRYFDAAHNYDCWDTTRNTTSLLLVLQDWKLLRHHVVADPDGARLRNPA